MGPLGEDEGGGGGGVVGGRLEGQVVGRGMGGRGELEGEVVVGAVGVKRRGARKPNPTQRPQGEILALPISFYTLL